MEERPGWGPSRHQRARRSRTCHQGRWRDGTPYSVKEEDGVIRREAGGQDNGWEPWIGNEGRRGEEGSWGNPDQRDGASKGRLLLVICVRNEVGFSTSSFPPVPSPFLVCDIWEWSKSGQELCMCAVTARRGRDKGEAGAVWTKAGQRKLSALRPAVGASSLPTKASTECIFQILTLAVKLLNTLCVLSCSGNSDPKLVSYVTFAIWLISFLFLTSVSC